MKRILAAMVLAVLMVSMAAAQSKRSNNVEAIDQARLKALQAGDADGMAKYLDDELIYIRPDGSSWNKAGYVDAVRSGKLKFRDIKHSEPRTITSKDVVILTGMTEAMIADGGEQRARYSNVYVRRNGEWKLVLMQVTRIAAAKSDDSGK